LQAVTFLVAVIACVIVFLTKPVWSLVIYCAVMAWYPCYLTVKLGTIDFPACRIIILVLYANLFLRTNLPKGFKVIWLDKLVVIYFLCQLLAGAANIPIMTLLENRAGAVFEMVLPYFAVRMIIASKQQYLTLLKGILVIAAPLALIGFYESLTGYNPVGFLEKYSAWGGILGLPNPRFGFFRARLVFSHPILFGLFFAMLGPACAGLLRNMRTNRLICTIGIGLMALGVFSSMSSGAFMAALLAIVFIAFYPFRKYWRAALAAVILMCLIVEIISNRHFYDVLGGFTLNPATAWYRSRLIEVALFEGGMAGHWLTGFGFRDPSWSIGGVHRVDMVNHYILILSKYGLIGLVPFLALIVAAVKKLAEAYRASIVESDQWLSWCLFGGLFGVLVGMNSVSLFGQPATVFYMLLAFCGTMSAIVTKSGNVSAL